MNKSTLITVSAVIVALIASPVIGMAVSPTRSLILGLSDHDSILQVADQIDTTRTDLEAKLAEKDAQVATLQSANTVLQSKIDDQGSQVDAQKADVAKAKADITAVKSDIADAKVAAAASDDAKKQDAKCQKLYTKSPACQGDHYRSKSSLNEQIAKNMNGCSDSDSCDAMKKQLNDYYDTCQTIYAQCN